MKAVRDVVGEVLVVYESLGSLTGEISIPIKKQASSRSLMAPSPGPKATRRSPTPDSGKQKLYKSMSVRSVTKERPKLEMSGTVNERSIKSLPESPISSGTSTP